MNIALANARATAALECLGLTQAAAGHDPMRALHVFAFDGNDLARAFYAEAIFDSGGSLDDALYWARKSAEGGEASGMEMLGTLLLVRAQRSQALGEEAGVEPLTWLLRAARFGRTISRTHLTAVAAIAGEQGCERAMGAPLCPVVPV